MSGGPQSKWRPLNSSSMHNITGASDVEEKVIMPLFSCLHQNRASMIRLEIVPCEPGAREL